MKRPDWFSDEAPFAQLRLEVPPAIAVGIFEYRGEPSSCWGRSVEMMFYGERREALRGWFRALALECSRLADDPRLA